MSEFLAFLQKKEVKKFIQEHLTSDLQNLILNPPTAFRNEIRIIADQILSRRKAKGKLDAWASNFDLIMPAPLSIEQASSLSTSDYKKQLVQGDHLIDLTGGMGIDCIALSEHFDKVTYVEQQGAFCAIFNHNCKVLQKDIDVKNGLAEEVLKQFQGDISKKIFYIDPARRDEAKNKVFKLEDCTPNLKSLLPMMQKIADQVLIKLSPLVDIKSLLSEFDYVKEIHVVSLKNDCKELLVLLDFSSNSEPLITAINLATDQPEYQFKLSEESSSASQHGENEGFIFEPNSSILKAGAFKKLGADLNLKKLHQHTHLYTSDTSLPDFPGRVFQAVAVADKKTIKQYGSDGKLNVLTRNYPIKPDALKKKWKLKDGGDFFLIGFRDCEEKPNLVIAKRIV